jgi:hypothetical protein
LCRLTEEFFAVVAAEEESVHDDRVIGHLLDDAEIVGTNRRSWFC